MILDIKTYPDKILLKKTGKVGEFDAETKKLIKDMAATLYAKKGAGLAANQVGAQKRIAVLDDGSGLLILVNPKITSKKGNWIMAEGCLSFPGLELEIKRPTTIEVEYLDQSGHEKKIKAEQLLARVICHEVDHLDGKTMLDRLPWFRRMKLKKELRKRKIH